MFDYLRFLSEAKIAKGKKSVVVTFMRGNPLTSGHEKLVDKLSSEAKKKNAYPMLFTSGTQDAKKNPLTFKDKVKLMTKAFPKVNVSTDPTLKTLFQIAGQLSDEGVKEFYLVVGSDRVEEFKRQLGKYVGATTGSLRLNFDKFSVISAGQRDENSDDVSGMSASKMRQFVVDNDEESFKGGLPKLLQADYINIFKLVKTGMKL